jgi:hypothetical protein
MCETDFYSKDGDDTNDTTTTTTNNNNNNNNNIYDLRCTRR